VHFSYARQGFQGSHLPPGFFVAARAVREAESPAPHPDLLEERLWLGGPAPESPPSAPRQAGFRRALRTALAPKGLDLTRSPLARSDLRERALEALRDKEGLLGVSPTGLQLFRQCPFGFLLERLLGLQQQEGPWRWNRWSSAASCIACRRCSERVRAWSRSLPAPNGRSTAAGWPESCGVFRPGRSQAGGAGLAGGRWRRSSAIAS
jgi:hypothetical protein